MSKTLDLNCDVGEIDSQLDRVILPMVSSCNVSCGAHSGDDELIENTVAEAIRLGVSIGAHPSYPDRENFGRTSMNLPVNDLQRLLNEQIEFLQSVVQSAGGELRHVKPHGALYNDMGHREELAAAVVEVILQHDLILYGQAESHLAEICESRNVRFVHEVFGDRRYEDRTTLRSRAHQDAIHDQPDEFQKHLQSLIEGTVTDVHQRTHSITTQTICLHSDTPRAIEFATLANQYLKENNVEIAAP